MTEDDLALVEAGYKPQLRRSMRLFSSFAFSFSLISITTGIFGNYEFVLSKSGAGPFGFWTWLLVAAGYTMVALVFAEMAARIPLTGYLYSWNTKLATPAIGWLTGWLALAGYVIAIAAVISTMLGVVQSIFDLSSGRRLCLTISVILAQTMINLFGARLASRINAIAVFAEIAVIIGLGGFILFAATMSGHLNFSLLTAMPTDPRPYWPSFLSASLLGAWALVGFEGAAAMSEETVDVCHAAPRAIVSSILISGILGFFFIVAITVSIPDVVQVSQSTSPILTVANYYMGCLATRSFLALILIAMFACSLFLMTAGSRLLFAMARDQALPASSTLQKTTTRQVPAAAVCLVTAGSFAVSTLSIFGISADNSMELYIDSSILAIMVYLITVVSFALGLRKLPPTTGFSLDYLRWPVIVCAITCLLSLVVILVRVQGFHLPALIATSISFVGLAMYCRLRKPSIEVD